MIQKLLVGYILFRLIEFFITKAFYFFINER